MKIWKGLHYCMWMQDKPLIQVERNKIIHFQVFMRQNLSLYFISQRFLHIFYIIHESSVVSFNIMLEHIEISFEKIPFGLMLAT